MNTLSINKKFTFKNTSNKFTNRLQVRINDQYSLSIIQGIGSYGVEEGLYEVAVLCDGHLDYSTPLTEDVIGYCTKEDVYKHLNQLDKWVEYTSELNSLEEDLSNHVNTHHAFECIRESKINIQYKLDKLFE